MLSDNKRLMVSKSIYISTISMEATIPNVPLYNLFFLNSLEKDEKNGS